jgi:hypothetical protein
MLCEMREATLRICGLANILRKAWESRAGPQEYGAARFSEIWSPRKRPRPIPQHSIIYGDLLAYIEKEDSFNENYLSIDIIWWYNYYCNCVLYKNLLSRLYFLIDIYFSTVSKNSKSLNIRMINRYNFSNS